MSDEKWTGRKYVAQSSGKLFEILTEPFEWAGKTYVGYGRDLHAETALTSAFENPDQFMRVIEPPAKPGDKLAHPSKATATVEAVSSRPDDDGDFLYLVIHGNGEPGVIWMGKTSADWTKVDASV